MTKVSISEESQLILVANMDIWNGYTKSLTLNTHQSGMQDLREVWEKDFMPVYGTPWESGCGECIINNLTTMYRELDNVSPQGSSDDAPPKKKAKKS